MIQGFEFFFLFFEIQKTSLSYSSCLIKIRRLSYLSLYFPSDWFSLLQRIDEDKLFNLFSLYGNIVRIKLLRNKPDHALVQMGDGFQAELAVHFLKV